MTGKLLGGRYELIEVIGIGGMAIVYKAKDKLLNRLVAVKVLKNEFNENEQFINKFKRESQSAASLSHNNIVNVFDVGVEENNHYIVMELVSGQTLKAYIKEKGELPWKEALFLVKQIAFALDHAHKNKIIHRDIKPHNIILNDEMIPKVTDFGIARAISSATITLVEETMGSVHYISPEQARGGFVDEKSDLYSLGIVLFEMITGKVPFDSDNSVSIAIKHIQEDIELPDDLDDVPLGLLDIIMKLVKKNPIDRYKNSRELIKDLILIQNNPAARIDDLQSEFQTKKTPIIADNQLNKKDKQEKGKDKKKIRKKVIIAVVILSVLCGMVIFALNSMIQVQEVEVPALEGKSLTEAIEILEENNLEYIIEKREHSSQVEKDHIIKQNPAAGAVLKEDQSVKLIVSDGPKEVILPDVTDKFEVEGTQILENMGFVIEEVTREFKDQYDKDKIYEQYPAAGTSLVEGSEIKLYVSKGKNTVVITDLTGKSLEEAKNIILSAGLVVGGDIQEVTSEKYDKNVVVSQTPKGGQEVAKDSVVNLTVSSGLIKTKSVTINLNPYVEGDNDDDDEESEPQKLRVRVLLINQANESTVAYNQEHLSNETITVNLKGVGVQYYQVQINNTLYEPAIISF
ncbi:Stk1 family PASTA domain-containing Ser/Thr kinase [Alkalibaculum sp. M08DMB]|uniref:non-specific serine/threonine protein kinase n=1 Tax=Alkalibaculum sporogenes TaxID=2655001 RepID=A0A6A7K9G4_9FIRM|nr:Stk1 family PASTA domain-containing Ser/Thr kinase [Alkalibaculum sporogenes]MPW26036.1 Stk1 family PASTA domain-containing Ser/Thr kinase [Alkalibaculum sporogenes]